MASQSIQQKIGIVIPWLFLAFILYYVIQLIDAESQANSIIEEAEQLAQHVELSNLRNDVEWLADDRYEGRKAGTQAADAVGLLLAKRYIELGLNKFTEAGLNDYHDAFQLNLKRSEKLFAMNIVGVLHGEETPNEYIVLSAHYDHLGKKGNQIYNGADDDATGVAALLEVARVLSQSQVRPKKSILFIAFSAEELGRQGAKHFCQNQFVSENAQNFTNLNFEMFGAVKGRGRYLNIWNTEEAQTIVDAVTTASKQLKFPLLTTFSKGPAADARSLQDCGVRATTIDVGGGAHFRDNHPHYHAVTDTPEHIDYGGFEKATQVALAATWVLANE